MNIYKQKQNKIANKVANKVALFCNARDEDNIKEWAAHHILLGFDHIIIFDHKSMNPLSNVFMNFNNKVQVMRCELTEGNIKLKLMNIANIIAKRMNLDWFIYLDADEFLILNKVFKGVKHFLNSYSYGDSIGVNWLMFGSNNLVEQPNGLILENYKKSCKILDKHVKSFVRPNEIINCVNPHYYIMRNPSKMLGLHFKKLTPPYYFSNFNATYYQAPAYIAHYVFQSEETYKKRKIGKKSDDGSTRNDMGSEIHHHYNDVINLQPQKYVRNIKMFLEYYK